MRGDDGDGLSPDLKHRLKSALDRLQPRFSSPRYLAARRRPFLWRLAPAAIAVLALSVLVLSAYAGTGSPNPVVWTEKVVNVVAPPAAPPTPAQQAPTQQTKPAKSQAPQAAPTHRASPEPSERPEPSQSPEPRESPEPSGSPEPGDTRSSSPAPTPTPTPTSYSGDAERS